MTDDSMNLQALPGKSADADFLREMIGFAAQPLMNLEGGSLTDAGYGEKSSDRLAQRNGYRERDWETRAGTAERRIPRLRTGSYILGLGLLLRIHLGAPPASTWRYWPVVGTVGLASLCASFWWTPAGAFPFPGAIWPCLSTAAMLPSFWMAPTAIAGRALAQCPFKFFGEISYSL